MNHYSVDSHTHPGRFEDKKEPRLKCNAQRTSSFGTWKRSLSLQSHLVKVLAEHVFNLQLNPLTKKAQSCTLRSNKEKNCEH